MEKYRIFIDDREFLIEMDGESIWIDGEEVHAGIHFLNEDGLFMVERDEGKREFHIKPCDQDTYQLTTRGLQAQVTVDSEKRRRKNAEEKKDAGIIKAPIPGVVTNVAVVEGEQVQTNQVLVVMESMKMLMEFRAPFEAIVGKILVAKGQKVEKGDEMVRLTKNKTK